MFSLSDSRASTTTSNVRVRLRRQRLRRCRPTPEVLEGRQLLATMAGGTPPPAFEAKAIQAGAGVRTWTPQGVDLQVDQGQANWLRVATATTSQPVGGITATIDWGDGVTTSGSVALFAIDYATPDAGDPTGVDVAGEHVYHTPGTFVVRTTIVTDDGSSTTVTSRVVASATGADGPALTLDGGLDPASDTGASNTDGLTSATEPRFLGRATPNATVQVFAAREGAASPVPIGQAVADGQGNWSIQSRLLAEGVYTITANARTADGRATPAVVLKAGRAGGPLVIDTTGPRIAGLTLDARSAGVRIQFTDNLSGLGPQGTASPTGTSFERLVGSRANTVALRPLSVSNEGPSVSLGFGRPLRNGRYTLRILASGVRDLAGNALDGEFGGSFATGNGQAGGDFAARFQVARRQASPPQTIPASFGQQIRRNRQRPHPGPSGALDMVGRAVR